MVKLQFLVLIGYSGIPFQVHLQFQIHVQVQSPEVKKSQRNIYCRIVKIRRKTYQPYNCPLPGLIEKVMQNADSHKAAQCALAFLAQKLTKHLNYIKAVCIS